jgi:hypothetical protein
LQNASATATDQQATVNAAVNAALASDGPEAAALIRQQYAQAGYVAPNQYQAQIQAITDNINNLQSNLSTAPAPSSQQ